MDDLLKELYIEPTSVCNLKCDMCARNAWFDEEIGHMSWELFEKVMAEANRMPSLKRIFFGGVAEPFSHPRFLDMVKIAKGTGKQVELITNGAFLTESIMTQLLTLNIHMIWVSFDGGNDSRHETIRKGSDYHKLVENLQRYGPLRDALKSQTKLGLTFVARKDTIENLPGVIEQANVLQASDLKISNLIPFEPAMMKETLYDLTLSSATTSKIMIEEKKLGQTQLHVPFMDFPRGEVGAALTKGILDSDYVKFNEHPIKREPGVCKFINEGNTFVKWNGDLCPCMALLHNNTTYLSGTERKITYKDFGNVGTESLDEIWNGQDYKSFRQRVQDFTFSPCTICGHCSFVYDNETDCYESPFPTCGACLWGENLVQCP